MSTLSTLSSLKLAMNFSVCFAVLVGTATAGATIISAQAQACPRSAEQLICPGDQIVSSENIVGTVLGVNPFQGSVAFRGNSSGRTYTRNKSSLSLGLGCLEMYCVGDIVVSSDNVVGTILAVNPYKNSIAFRGNSSGNVYTRGLESLALGLGCVRGICVEDTVISSTNIVGTVLAVNPFRGEVAFRGHSSGNVYTRTADSLSSTEYCASYGSFQRSQQRFPFVNERVFITLDFKFSTRRPRLP